MIGNVTEYEYDEEHRLVKTLEPDPDGEGPLPRPVSIQEYDAAGQLVKSIRATGKD